MFSRHCSCAGTSPGGAMGHAVASALTSPAAYFESSGFEQAVSARAHTTLAHKSRPRERDTKPGIERSSVLMRKRRQQEAARDRCRAAKGCRQVTMRAVRAE